MRRSQININNIVLILLILANFLELFVPRVDTGNYFVRLPIQIIDGSVLILMWLSLLLNKVPWNPITKIVVWFIILILVYAGFYFLSGTFTLQGFAPYLRFLLWITSIVFLFQQALLHGINRLLYKCLLLIFLLIVSRNIINTLSMIDLEGRVGGGDTAALPLLFSIPLIMYFFDRKLRIIIMGIVIIMMLYSLRRTAILGMILCLPFFYKEIKARLKFIHVLLILLVLVLIVSYTWEQVGGVIVERFRELLSGDQSGRNEDSFGSGRSIFYAIVWNHWVGGSTLLIFTGYGLHSVHVLLMKTYGIGHTHNDFLEIAHTFGIIGLALWFIFMRNIWILKKKIKRYAPHMINIFYISIISYFVIALASGCILRITTLPFAISIVIFLYESTERKRIYTFDRKRETNNYFFKI